MDKINSDIGINTQLNTLKGNLVNIINNSGLPIGICYYIVKDLIGDLTESYKEAILFEKANSIAEKDKKEQ